MYLSCLNFYIFKGRLLWENYRAICRSNIFKEKLKTFFWILNWNTFLNNNKIYKMFSFFLLILVCVYLSRSRNRKNSIKDVFLFILLLTLLQVSPFPPLSPPLSPAPSSPHCRLCPWTIPGCFSFKFVISTVLFSFTKVWRIVFHKPLVSHTVSLWAQLYCEIDLIY